LLTASSAAANPTFEWVPSQKGFVVDAPQRHNAIGFRVAWYSLPFQSMTRTSSPSMTYGPFFRNLIVVTRTSLAD
jgi:hypothetical protein